MLADQLIEADDPRGPFIAHQLALTRLAPTDPEVSRLLAATDRLQAEHARTWLQPLLDTAFEEGLPGRAAVLRGRNAIFRRGFLHRIALALDELPMLDGLRAQTPLDGIELLVGESAEGAPPPTSAGDWTTFTLSPEGWFTASSLAQVLHWSLESVQILDVSGCDLGESGAQLLTGEPTDLGSYFEDFSAPPAFAEGQLTQLMLKNTNLGDAGLAVLVRATNLNGLTALGLEQCKLTADADLAGLREAPCAANLVALWLGGNAIELTALNGWDRWQTLRVASLPKSLTPDGFTALSDRFPALEELHLAGAKALLKEPARVFAGLPSLTSLNLSTTGLKDAGMTALLASPFAHQLTTLRVNGCSLSDKALDALMASAARRLVHLDLSSNKLTDAVLTRLAAWEGLEHLTELRLGNNRKLTAAGHDALMASPYFDPVVFDVGKLKDEELRARLVTHYGDRLLHR